MKHNDIYVKFMIEYDKANVTSSYPSLTEYEVATVLDKAYNALIAQKVTGNNVRRSTFESDVKAIADLAPLTTNKNMGLDLAKGVATNVSWAYTPPDMLYFLQANMTYNMANINTNQTEYRKYEDGNGDKITIYSNQDAHPFDRQILRKLPVKLVNHEIALKFFSSAFNMPWIKEPVCYLEEDKIYVVYDPLDVPELVSGAAENPTSSSFVPKGLDVFYIKKPNLFVKDLDEIRDMGCTECSYFMYKNPSPNHELEVENRYTFECNDTVAEELISLAVAFALENVESARLNSKLNMRGLEA